MATRTRKLTKRRIDELLTEAGFDRSVMGGGRIRQMGAGFFVRPALDEGTIEVRHQTHSRITLASELPHVEWMLGRYTRAIEGAGYTVEKCGHHEPSLIVRTKHDPELTEGGR